MMKSISIAIVCWVWASLIACAQPLPELKIKASLTQPDNTDFEATALVKSLLLHKDKPNGLIDGNFDETFSVTISLIYSGERDGVDDVSGKLSGSAKVVLEACGAHLQVDGGTKSDRVEIVTSDTTFTTTVSVKILKMPDDVDKDSNDPGNSGDSGGGMGGGGGGGPGCSSCITLPIPGGTTVPVARTPADFSIPLGIDSGGYSLGRVIFYKDSIADGAVSLSNFSLKSVHAASRLINSSGVLKQALSEKMIVDFAVLGGGVIEAKAYDISAKGDPVSSSSPLGPYTITGIPFCIYRFSGLTTDGVYGAGVRVEKNFDGGTAQYWILRAHDGTSGRSWRAEDWLGKVIYGTEVILSGVTPAEWTRSLQQDFKSISGSNEYFTGKHLYEFESGPQGEVMTAFIEGGGGVIQETFYDHYGTIASEYPSGVPLPVQGKIRYVIRPDGSWTKYNYNPDGSLGATLSPWLDAPSHPNDATDANCRVVMSDGGTSSEKILGATVKTKTTGSASTWYWVYNGPNAPYGEWLQMDGTYTSEGGVFSGNYYSEDGRAIFTPGDGTAIYTFSETGNWVNGVFYADENGTAVRTERGKMLLATNTAEFGFMYFPGYSKRIISIVQNGLTVFSGEEVRTGESPFGAEEWNNFNNTTYSYDAKRRVTSIVRDGDTIQSTVYHSDLSRTVTDAYGVSTTYTSSSDGRVLTTVVHGINGTDDITTVSVTAVVGLATYTSTETSAGSMSQTVATNRVVDILGRVVSSTDELGRTTSYTYPAPRTTRVTYLNGDNETKVVHRDGQVKELIRRKSSPSGAVEPDSEYYSYLSPSTTRINYGSEGSARFLTKVKDYSTGRIMSESRPGPGGVSSTTYTYNYAGRVTAIAKTGMATELTDHLGDLSGGNHYRTGFDLDNSGNIEESGNDPLIEIHDRYLVEEGWLWKESSRSAMTINGGNSDTQRRTIIREKLGMGADSQIVEMESYGDVMNATTTTTTVNRSAATVTRSQTDSRSSGVTTEVLVGGRLKSTSRPDQSVPITYEYDSLGRRSLVDDPSTGETIFTYNIYGQPLTITDEGGGVTSYEYYGNAHVNAGKVKSVKDPEGKVTHSAYDVRGMLTHSWGATHPVKYEYDAFGKMVKMHTYRSFNEVLGSNGLPEGFVAPGDVTEWIYNGATGLLEQKKYANNEATTFSYYSSGLMHTRVWARGITTTYAYDGAGRITLTDYSDATRDITRSYHRDGTMATVAGMEEGSVQRDISVPWEGGNGYESKTYSGGLFDGITIYDTYSPQRKIVSRAIQSVNGIVAETGYSYNALGKVDGVSHQVGQLTINTSYGYDPVRGYLAATATGLSGEAGIATTVVRGVTGKLSSITTVGQGSSVISGRTYQRDLAGRITRSTLPGGEYWEYAYDAKNQVSSGVKRAQNGAAIYGLGMDYEYDSIGNRSGVESTANLPGLPLGQSVYTPNSVNQYVSKTNASSHYILGDVIPAANVQVNGTMAERQGTWFASNVAGNNTSGPAWLPVSIEATHAGGGMNGANLSKVENGHLYLPPATEQLTYDADGNLTSDGRWSYTWDGENRLIAVQTNQSAIAAGIPIRRVEYAYDGLGHRISRAEPKWNTQTSQFDADLEPTAYLWSDWNLMAEFKITSEGPVLQKSNAWGLDVVESLESSGNVGGLLSIIDLSQSEPVTLLPCYDGNGNIIGLASAGTATSAAVFDYDSFGKQMVRNNIPAQVDPASSLTRAVDGTEWGFSTKQQDRTVGLLYYGYRFYDSSLGRWLSRDPVEERGGVNLYAFLDNDGVNYVDILGLETIYLKLPVFYTISGRNGTRIKGINNGPEGTGTVIVTLDKQECRVGGDLRVREVDEELNKSIPEYVDIGTLLALFGKSAPVGGLVSITGQGRFDIVNERWEKCGKGKMRKKVITGKPSIHYHAEYLQVFGVGLHDDDGVWEGDEATVEGRCCCPEYWWLTD